MTSNLDLESFLRDWVVADGRRGDIAKTIIAICGACQEIGNLAARGALAGLPAPGKANGSADPSAQRPTVFDLIANDYIVRALRNCPVAAIASEALSEPWSLNKSAPLLVAVDPMDGSNTIDTNATMGTVFSLLPVPEGMSSDLESAFLQPGRNLLAAGFVVYGPQTALVLSLGQGTHIFTLDRERSMFYLTERGITIPCTTHVFAINASNYMRWDDAIRTYVDDCMRGVAGPRKEDFNMRWSGSVVTEIYRIFTHGGIYLYPADNREAFACGQLRLIYEANPIAFVVEQAQGAASCGREAILGITPRRLCQKSPIIVGSRKEVEYVDRLYGHPETFGERSPLFGRRGLFRL